MEGSHVKHLHSIGMHPLLFPSSGWCLAQWCSMLLARSVAEPHGILALLLESGGGLVM